MESDVAARVKLMTPGVAACAGGGPRWQTQRVGCLNDLYPETFGFARHVTRFLKIERGVVFKPGGTQQLVLAWEYSFAGES